MRLRASNQTNDPEQRVAIMGGVAVGVAFAVIGALLGVLLGVGGFRLIIMAVAVGGAVGYLVQRFARAVAAGAGAGVSAFIYPSGNASPYEMSFSAHDALEARDDATGAIAAYEASMAEYPGNVRAKRQAAELYVRAGNPRRAAELFAEIRKLPGLSSSDELYSTQRLADLYLGPLGDGGRALVELRRVAERFPGTREANGARLAIARMKQDAALPGAGARQPPVTKGEDAD